MIWHRDGGWDWGWRAWVVVLLLLVMHALTACAARTTARIEPHYIILRDNLPLGTEVCVPSTLATADHQYHCIPVEFIRWMLRHQEKG